MNKNLVCAAASLLIAYNAPAQQTIIHDPNAEIRSVGRFTAVSVSGNINIYLSQAGQEAVAVSAGNKKQRDNIRVEVKDGILQLWEEKDGLNLGSNKNLKAYIAFRTLEKISASGTSDVFIQGRVEGDELTISLSGASDLKGKVRLGALYIMQSGASDATLTGTARTVVIRASGASDCNSYGLTTDTCTVHASGASNVSITVNKVLTAASTGGSAVSYKGDGTVTNVKASGGNVTRKS